MYGSEKKLEEESGEKTPKKSFKDYEPGFIHIDIKYLPKMQDETSRSYLLVAIDRATRWAHLVIFPDKTAHSAQCFLQQVIDKTPFTISKLLTDNGKYSANPQPLILIS